MLKPPKGLILHGLVRPHFQVFHHFSFVVSISIEMDSTWPNVQCTLKDAASAVSLMWIHITPMYVNLKSQ